MNVFDYSGSQRIRRSAVIPQDADTIRFLYDVDCQTKCDVESHFDPCPIINYDWHCNTIANATVEGFIKSLNTDMKEHMAKTAQLNFYNLFSIKVTTKVNEDAEKEGNINVSFYPGPTAIELISLDKPDVEVPKTKTTFGEFFKIEIPDEDTSVVEAINAKYADIEQYIRYGLSNNYGIAIPTDNAFMTFAICYHFILNIFRKLLRELGANPDQNQVSVNFNDLIEFHASRNENDEVILVMRPGLTAKLLIKSDETTEDEDDDDYSWAR